MSRLKKPIMRIVAPLLLAAVALSGCAGSAPSRFYQVTSPEPPGSATLGLPAQGVVGLETVRIADYADRQELVLRGAGGNLQVLEFDRWGGALPGMITSALARRISARLPGTPVTELPAARRLPLSHVVEVELDRFDAEAAGDAVLEARWRVFGREGDEVRRFGRTVTRQPVTTPGEPGAVVVALTAAVDQLAADIATAVTAARP